MCTAITYKTQDHYFGRNLDLERSFGETVTVTPRNYPFIFRNGTKLVHHYAMIGMATVADNYPLYYEATNEKGLSMAGLNFPGNAIYFPHDDKKVNIASFELIPWLLAKYETVAQLKDALHAIQIEDLSFAPQFPASPLHWLADDGKDCITIETTASGMHVWDNPVGVLTNNPTFDYHMPRLSEFMNLTSVQPENRFSKKLDLQRFSLGMGSIGLPGDPSSVSRFVKAAFVKHNSVCGMGESESISQFFHILGSVAQQRGITQVSPGVYEITRYSSCCNASRGIYYYTTYENSCVRGVDMHRCDLEGESLLCFPITDIQQIAYQN